MAWNEPGSKGDEKDPWTGKNKQQPDPSGNLEAWIKKTQNHIANFFGKKSTEKKYQTSTAKNGSVAGIIFFLIAIISLWFLSGILIVQPSEQAVVLWWGKYDKTIGPGLHWLPRFIGSAEKIDTQKIYSLNYPNNIDTQLLTNDGNIISVAVTVRYRISNPRNFLFNIADPIDTLNQATASALRQVIAANAFDNILTTGRDQVRQNLLTQLKNILAPYNSGIEITDVALKSVKAPDAVRDAFKEVIKARADKEHLIQQANDYAAQNIPLAQAQAKLILAKAQTYQKEVVLQAQANTAAFLAILPEYKSATDITKERLYLAAMENILKNNDKILIDMPAANNLVYLPLDKLLSFQNQKTTETKIQPPPQTPLTSQAPKSGGTTSRPERPLYQGYGKGGPY